MTTDKLRSINKKETQHDNILIAEVCRIQLVHCKQYAETVT